MSGNKELIERLKELEEDFSFCDKNDFRDARECIEELEGEAERAAYLEEELGSANLRIDDLEKEVYTLNFLNANQARELRNLQEKDDD